MTLPVGPHGPLGPGTPPAEAAQTASLRGPRGRSQPTQTEDVARQFESLLVQQLWQTMRKTVSGAGFGGGGAGSDTYMHFMDEALANQMTEAGGIGLRQVLEGAMGNGPETSRGLNAYAQASGASSAIGPSRPRSAPVELGPMTGTRMSGATGRLQDAARSLLSGESAQRFGREGRLTNAELSSEFETTRPDGSRAAFNVHDAAGFEGEYKCNIFAFEMARRAGFQTPLQGRPHGWGYPAPDSVTAQAASGRLPRDWGRVVTGESAEVLDANLRAGERGIMLTSSGTDGHAGHMAVVERIHEIRYDDDGEISQVVFDGWEARSRGARHLTERTWNRVGTRGGEDPRGGLSRIEMIELLAPRGGVPEMPISNSAGPSRHD